MSSGSFKSIFLQTIHLEIKYDLYIENLALNNQQLLICQKNPSNQLTFILTRTSFMQFFLLSKTDNQRMRFQYSSDSHNNTLSVC